MGDYLYNWTDAMYSYKLFRRDRQGRRGGVVAQYVMECLTFLMMVLKGLSIYWQDQ